MATMTAREFNHDVSAAKRAAESEPVIITDRGSPSHVLLSYTDYVARLGGQPGLYDLLWVDDDLDVELEPLHIALQVPEL